MRPELRDWWVTVWLDRQRTADHVVRASSEWAAGWLYRQLHPGAEVLSVRPAKRS